MFGNWMGDAQVPSAAHSLQLLLALQVAVMPCRLLLSVFKYLAGICAPSLFRSLAVQSASETPVQPSMQTVKPSGKPGRYFKQQALWVSVALHAYVLVEPAMSLLEQY